MNIFSRRKLLSRTLGAGALLGTGTAALAEDCVNLDSGGAPALKVHRLLSDWAYLERFRADNAALRASGARVEVVFMGDSITEGWLDKMPDLFTNGRVSRGISAQTTPQMLVRMHPDVVSLKPRAVHIMAGTNDIAGNTGPMTTEESQGNLRAMAEIAMAHGIRVIFASIPPAANYPWRPGLTTAEPIMQLNDWLRGYAKSIGAVYADYHSALSNGKGGMRPGLASDEVHPTIDGYRVMRPVAEAAIAKMGTLPPS